MTRNSSGDEIPERDVFLNLRRHRTRTTKYKKEENIFIFYYRYNLKTINKNENHTQHQGRWIFNTQARKLT